MQVSVEKFFKQNQFNSIRNEMKSFIALLVIFVASINSAKLPEWINRCSRKDPKLNECVLKSAQKFWPRMKDGYKKLHVPRLDPLYVEHITIQVDNSLTINAYKANIYGFGGATFKKIDVDLDKQTVDALFTSPVVSIVGKYDVNGKLLLLPIKGSGPCNLTIVDGVYKYHMEYKLKEKEDGKTHIEPTTSDFSYTCSRAYFKLDNLFDGNKILGDNMNKVLDDNWQEVNNELGGKLAEAFSDILTHIVSGITKKVTYDDLWLD